MLPRRSRAGRATARPDRALQPAEGTFDICHIAMPCTSFCLQAHTRLHLFFHSHLLTVTAHNATRLDGEALNMAGTVRPQCWPRPIMMLLLRTQPSTHLPIRLSNHLSIHLPACLLVCPSDFPSARPPACPPVRSACPPVRSACLLVRLSACPPARPPAFPPARPPAHLPARPPICLPANLPAHPPAHWPDRPSAHPLPALILPLPSPHCHSPQRDSSRW